VTKITGTLHEDVSTHVTISCGILLRIRNVLAKNVERIRTHTHFMFSNFLLENRAVYEIMSKNIVQPDNII
jgi:hypothetical protein